MCAANRKASTKHLDGLSRFPIFQIAAPRSIFIYEMQDNAVRFPGADGVAHGKPAPKPKGKK